MAAFALHPEVLVLGAILGAGYGLLGAGLILAFRASGTLHLALGQCGALAAVLLTVAVEKWRIPYWWSFGPALLAGAALSASVEVGVVRRLAGAPAVVTVIATLGAGQVLSGASAAVLSALPPATVVPQPPLLPTVPLGALTLTPAYLALLAVAPAVTLGLWYAGGRTPVGVAFRAAADNPAGARLLGLPAARFATGAWALGGALAALVAILTLPAGAGPAALAVGPALLLRALAVAALAGMASVPAAMAAGIAVGMAEQVALFNAADPGVANALLVVVIVVAVLARRSRSGRLRDPRAGWLRVKRVGRLTRDPARRRPAVELAGAVVAVGVGALPLLAAPQDQVAWAVVCCFAIVGISAWIVAGLAGALSLGQLAFAAIGALAAVVAGRLTGEPLAGLLAAPLGGGVAATAAGLAARGGQPIALPLVTLALALAVSTWLLPRPWAFGTGVLVEPLRIGRLDASTPSGGYALAFCALLVAAWTARRLASGGVARRLVATRENPDAAGSLGISARAMRLRALAAGGALAGLAGAVLVQVVGEARSATFAAAGSIEAIAIAAVGGLGSWAGGIAGALYITGLPRFVDLSPAAAAATAAGWLSLLLVVPGGIMAVLAPALGRFGAALVTAPGRASSVAGVAPRPGAPGVLRLERLTRRFGDVIAVDGAQLSVAPGETVVVVGPNGAGKTTLLDLASGALGPDAGRVSLGGEDVTRWPAHRRARRGIVRSFQDPVLFPAMTLLETVALARERVQPTPMVTIIAGGSRLEASQLAVARATIASVGLAGREDARLADLSTGARRLAELACVLAAEPGVLLLDEPSAGIAAGQRARLTETLRAIREQLGIGMLIVTQDLDLAKAIADRVAVMHDGRITAEGPPHDVLEGWLVRQGAT